MGASTLGFRQKARDSDSTGVRKQASYSAPNATRSIRRTASNLWTPEAIQNQTERQELIQWAQNLDKSLCRTEDTPQWTYFMTMTFAPRERRATRIAQAPDAATLRSRANERRPAPYLQDMKTGKTLAWMPPRRAGTIPTHHAMSAGPILLRWCSRWQSVAFSPTFRLLLWSAEAHSMGNVHLHALSVCTPGALQRHCPRCQDVSSRRDKPDWWHLKESWWMHYGKAVVRPYDPSLKFGAERYVTKYVLDENCLDWGLETW